MAELQPGDRIVVTFPGPLHQQPCRAVARQPDGSWHVRSLVSGVTLLLDQRSTWRPLEEM